MKRPIRQPGCVCNGTLYPASVVHFCWPEPYGMHPMCARSARRAWRFFLTLNSLLLYPWCLMLVSGPVQNPVANGNPCTFLPLPFSPHTEQMPVPEAQMSPCQQAGVQHSNGQVLPCQQAPSVWLEEKRGLWWCRDKGVWSRGGHTNTHSQMYSHILFSWTQS